MNVIKTALAITILRILHIKGRMRSNDLKLLAIEYNNVTPQTFYTYIKEMTVRGYIHRIGDGREGTSYKIYESGIKALKDHDARVRGEIIKIIIEQHYEILPEEYKVPAIKRGIDKQIEKLVAELMNKVDEFIKVKK